MNVLSSVTWLLPYIALPTFYAGIAILMFYLQPNKVNIQYRHPDLVSVKQQLDWIIANQIAINYFVYTTIGFLLGLIAFLATLGKPSVERWHGGSMNLFIICSCTLIMILPNAIRNYKLKQIAARSEKTNN